MDWNKGFSAQYYVKFVDPETWKDRDRFEIKGGSIKYSDSGLMCSADLECNKYEQNAERWVRIYLDANQSGSTAHEPLFTGLAVASQRDIEGRLVSTPVACYSVLKPAQDVLLPLGYYAQTGVRGAELVKQLLSATTPAPVTVIGNSPSLSQYIIAEDNENHLSMSEKILAAIDWRLRIKGDGSIDICSKARTTSASFDPLENDSIEPKIKAVNDWYGYPNVFRAIIEDTSAIARDDNPKSPLSTVNRGREVWAEEKDCHLNVNETLAEYARRRLTEEQRQYLSVSYDRRFRPDVIASDLVRLHYPEQKVDGIFYIVSQSIDLNYGARTSEEVVQV